MTRHLATQELRQKKKQLLASTNEITDTQALIPIRDAIARLNEELGDMGVHLGLLQHQLMHQPDQSSHAVLAV